MEDLENDDFDIEPAVTSPAPAVEPPAFLLSADKVKAVRFHQAKPGYVFTQVETFVDQVTQTLDYLEKQLYASQVAIHEKQEEIYDLQETISTLKATIEVFRANGDPLTAADGSFVTESQLVDPAEVEALRAERDRLAAELAQAQSDADRGWEAEAELRRYVEETLTPWIESVQAQQAAGMQLDVVQAPATTPEYSAAPADEPAALEVSVQEPASEPASTGAPASAPEEVAPIVAEDEAYLARLQQAISALEGGADASMLAEDLLAEAEPGVSVDRDAEPTAEAGQLPEADDFAPAALEEQLIAEAREAHPELDTVLEEQDTLVQEPVPAPQVEEVVSQSSPFAVPAQDDLGGFDEPATAPAADVVAAEPRKARKTKSHLASSPEVAALGGEAVIDDVADVETEATIAPQAGAPIPRLLASAPEVLAAGLPVDPDEDDAF